MHAMRSELVALWERSTAPKEQLVRRLQDWCRRAETSGIPPLVEFSRRLRSTPSSCDCSPVPARRYTIPERMSPNKYLIFLPFRVLLALVDER